MKLVLVLMFFSHWFNAFVIVNSNACTDQSFTTPGTEDIKKKFKNEYSFVASVTKKFQFMKSGPKEISMKDPAMAKQLCACALANLSIQKSDGKALESKSNEIIQNLTYTTTKLTVYIWPYALFYHHRFPAIHCIPTAADLDSCVIAKGPQINSNGKQVHNIYVTNIKSYDMDDDLIYDFLGVINNVDLEKLAREIKETPAPASTSQS